MFIINIFLLLIKGFFGFDIKRVEIKVKKRQAFSIFQESISARKCQIEMK